MVLFSVFWAAGPAAALTAAPVYSQNGTWFTFLRKEPKTTIGSGRRKSMQTEGNMLFPYRALILSALIRGMTGTNRC